MRMDGQYCPGDENEDESNDASVLQDESKGQSSEIGAASAAILFDFAYVVTNSTNLLFAFSFTIFFIFFAYPAVRAFTTQKMCFNYLETPHE